MQVRCCFLRGKQKSTQLSLPARRACWCPVHAQDPLPLTIWVFITLVPCCTPQLLPLFLLNPAPVLHTDECVLHLVLDEQLPEKAKAPGSLISILSIPATSTVSSGAVVCFSFTDCPHHHQLSFPCVHLLLSLCKAVLLQLLTLIFFGACETAGIMQGQIIKAGAAGQPAPVTPKQAPRSAQVPPSSGIL